MRSLSPSRREAQTKEIEEELLGPQRVLRKGSLPKWINPKTDAEDIPPYAQLQMLALESGSEDEVDDPNATQEISDRPPILRKDRFKRTQTLNDLDRSPSPSQDHSEIRWAQNPAMAAGFERPGRHQLCATCRGINFETMTDDGGYDHLLLHELDKSKSTCRMCHLIYHQLGYKMEDHTPDRYRIRLSLIIDDEDIDRWRDDHYTSFESASEREFSSALIEAMDLRPWEPPENYKTRHYYEESQNPEKFLKPRGSSPETVRSQSIYCFTEEDDPARRLGIRWIRHVGANTASTSSLETAKDWLSKCLSSEDSSSNYRSMPHSSSVRMTTRMEADTDFDALHQTFNEEYPTRLLKINQTRSGDLTLRLIETQNKYHRYAALSYCWGTQKLEERRKWQLTKANNGPHYENIKMDKLPPTVCDSNSIAWKLGIAYIWVDALCITQDSASDWAQEAAKMGGIYLGSLVTIAVSASPSAEHGCFNSRSQRATELGGFEDLTTIKGNIRDGRESCLYFLKRSADIPDMYRDEVVDGPLSKRAWTYQEYVLPRRILYFTSKQLLWECEHCRLSEDNFPQIQSVRPYPILDFEYVLDQDTIASFWYIGAVQQYSQRQMTFEKDKLVAISALARATHNNRQASYIAGLWRDSLTLGLTWCRSSNGHKSTTFSCPSWSWASQNSEISYRFVARQLERLDNRNLMQHGNKQDDEGLASPTSRIISVDWKADLTNTFGNLSDAHIDLCTILSTGTVVRDHFEKATPCSNTWDYSQAIMIPYTSQSGKAEWWHARATMDGSGVAGAQVVIALLRESTTCDPAFLLLHPPDPAAKTFRRVGLAELDDLDYRNYDRDWNELTNNWVEKTIRLV